MKAELVPLDGDAPIPIAKDLMVVGRREYCDIQIPHSSLSKRHCVIVRTDGLLMIRDLITTNGTKVNGQRVMWAALLPNDRLTLGAVKFRVYLGSDDAPSPSESYKKPLGSAQKVTEPGRLGAKTPQIVAHPKEEGPGQVAPASYQPKASRPNPAPRPAAILDAEDEDEVIVLDDDAILDMT